MLNLFHRKEETNSISVKCMLNPRYIILQILALLLASINLYGISSSLPIVKAMSISGFAWLQGIVPLCLILLAMVLTVRIGRKGNEKFTVKEINIRFCVIYYIAAISILVSSFHHYVGTGFRAFSLMMMFVFPVFYFFFRNEEDRKALFLSLAWAHVVTGAMLAIFCFYYAPYNYATFIGGRYNGIVSNPNTLALNMIVGVICAVYLYSQYRGKVLIPITVFICIYFGLMTSTGSRTAMLAAGAAVVICLTAFLISIIRSKHERRILITKSIVLVVVLLLCPSVNTLLFQLDNHYNKAANVKNPTENNVPLSNVVVDTIEENEQLDTESTNRFLVNGKTLDELSSFRISIWKEYISRLNWNGRDVREYPVVKIGETAFWGAHNTPLEIAYRCGIFTGVMYLVFELYLLLFVIINLFVKRKIRSDLIFSYIAISGYFIASMLDVHLLPVEASYILLASLSFGPVMFQNRETLT